MDIIKENRNFEVRLQTETVRQLFIKIEILDTQNNVINEVSGSAIGGDYNIDSTSAVRRTCSVQFKLEQGYLPDRDNSDFWINKRFKLYVGLKRFDNDEIYWFNKGTYAIQDPNINISINEKSITLNGLDKMALYNGDISGQLEYAIIQDIEDGNGEAIYVEDAVTALMRDGGETNLLITETGLPIPYKIESSIGDTRWDILSKYLELFYDYQAYYNLDGYFIFNKKPAFQTLETVQNDIVMDFSEETDMYKDIMLSHIPHDLIININRDVAYSNIKNKVSVYGGVHDDGYQSSYKIMINEEDYPNSPYTIEKLNERYSDDTFVCRSIVIQDDTYIDSGAEEGNINVTLIPQNNYKFEISKHVDYFQIKLPSYCEADIPNSNNAWGIAKEKQCVCYDVIWDGVTYSNLLPKNYYGDTYYVGNVYILENLEESGDYTENDDTGEPFVCWYDGVNFGIYTNDNTVEEHTVKFIRKETTNHAYSIELCKQRAEQEIYLHQQATDTVKMTCLPIYSLDVNEVIKLNDTESGAVGEYVITNISCGLGVGDTMSITANKLW